MATITVGFWDACLFSGRALLSGRTAIREGIGSGHTETICTKVYSTKILLFPHAFDNRLAYSFIFLKIVDLGKE